MSININSVPVKLHADILSQFPASWQEKLRKYTGEELFYFYKLCLVKPRHIRDPETKDSLGVKNMYLLTIQAKFKRWAKGLEKYPIHGDVWVKLASKYRQDFLYLVQEYQQVELAESEELARIKDIEIAMSKANDLANAVNNKRIG